MKKVEYNEIIIDWAEKIPISNTKDLNKIKEPEGDILYQLYGDHHIYGRDVLIYIGISNNQNRRLSQHLRGVFGKVNNLGVSIGTLSEPLENLEVAESILVANHKPSFNKEFIHDLALDAKKIREKTIIINNGFNYMLKTACTNFWWVD